MTRGEVWWGDVPGVGRRPCLVLTRDAAIPVLRTVVVAMLTRTIRGIPTEVVLETADGVPERSAVSLDNLQTVPKRNLVTRITELSRHRLDDVCEALRFAMGC
jgi:mRNA interferase MazF